MNEKDFKTRIGVIKNTFNDKRKIQCEVKNDIEIDEGIHQGGDLFKTEDGDILLPAVEDFIEEVDNENKILYTNYPIELVDLNKNL